MSGIAAERRAMSLSSMATFVSGRHDRPAGRAGKAQACPPAATALRLARFQRRVLDPFENLRTEAEHREDQQHEQRREHADEKVSQFRLHAGARTTQQPGRSLAWMEHSPV